MRSKNPKPLLAKEVRAMKGWEDDTDVDDAKPRQLTDAPCCVIFAAVMFGMCYMYRDASKSADIRKLTHGIDWMGRVCGVDPNVTDKPLLYWCVSSGLTATDGICVESCPSTATTSHLCPGKQSLNQTYMPLADGQYRVSLTIERSVSQVADHPSKNVLDMFCLPTAVEDLRGLADVPQLHGAAHQIMFALEGVYNRATFLAVIGIAVALLSFVMVYAMTLVIEVVAAGLLIIVGLIQVCGSVFFFYVAYNPLHNPFSPWGDTVMAKNYALGAGFLLLVLVIVYAVAIHCLQESLRESMIAIRKAQKALDDLPTLATAPVMQLVIKMVALVLLLFGLLTVLSLAKIVSPALDVENNGTGLAFSGVGRSLKFEDWQWRWVVAWIFGSIWIQETVIALGQYAVAHAAVMYELNKDEVSHCHPLAHGFFNGLWYHLGTCAFGGFIIGVVSAVSAVCSFLARQVKDEEGKARNTVAKAACCCCQCCCGFLEMIVRLNNELVYVDCAIFGSDYPEASWQVYHMLVTHAATVGSAKLAAKLMNVLCIGSLSAAGTLFTYFYWKEPHMGTVSQLAASHTWGTTIAAFVICYTLSSTFMSTFSALVDVEVYVGLIRKEKYDIGFGEHPDGYQVIEAIDGPVQDMQRPDGVV